MSMSFPGGPLSKRLLNARCGVSAKVMGAKMRKPSVHSLSPIVPLQSICGAAVNKTGCCLYYCTYSCLVLFAVILNLQIV